MKIINEKKSLEEIKGRIDALYKRQCDKFTEEDNNRIAILSVKLQTITTRLKAKKYKV